MGENSACIGTLGCDVSLFASDIVNSELTTPDVTALRDALQKLASYNVHYVAIEASSHAIIQKRLHGLSFNIAGFTSFASEHLDYHGTIEKYLQSKIKLFENHMPKGSTIVVQDEIVDLLPDNIKEDYKIISVGIKGDVRIKYLQSSLNKQSVIFSYKDKEFRFYTKILGDYQIDNILIAATLAHSLNIDWEILAPLLSKLQEAPGRLEKIYDNIFIDYAHNERALRKVLSTLRKLKKPIKIVIILCRNR